MASNLQKLAYSNYRKTNNWRDKKATIEYRQNYLCATCGKRKRGLQIHHLKYENLYDTELEELVGLCLRCHQLAPAIRVETLGNDKSKWKQKFREEIRSLFRIKKQMAQEKAILTNLQRPI